MNRYAKYTSDKKYKKPDCVFERRYEAKLVLELMEECIDRFGFVTKVNFYELSGIRASCVDDADLLYGWTNLNNAKVVRTRTGYTLSLPTPIEIK